jgi:hypothetical protein
MSNFEYIYNKKVILTFDDYDHFYEHCRDHELYMDWIYTDLTGESLSGNAVPDAIGGPDPLSTTWWCGQTRLEAIGSEIPQWSEAIEAQPITAIVLIPEQFLHSFLTTVQRIGVSQGAIITNITVVDHPA